MVTGQGYGSINCIELFRMCVVPVDSAEEVQVRGAVPRVAHAGVEVQASACHAAPLLALLYYRQLRSQL